MKPSHWRLLAIIVACATLNSPAVVRYVDVNSTNATPPYTNWTTAATNIQDAVDVAANGDEILVTNGVYATGGRTAGSNPAANRVAVDKPVTVRSVNGPQLTQIQGSQPGAIRCVYLANGASLYGFTLTNGATQPISSSSHGEGQGGGVWCESVSAVVSNCVMVGNTAGYTGGGAFGGTLYRCTLSGNSALGGGGAHSGTLNNCTLSRNSATYGGGAGVCSLNACALYENSASQGGGVDHSTLNNCTLVLNSARSSGGGAWSCQLNNCIVYFNRSPSGANDDSSTMNYCCTTPVPGGLGNITLDPQLASVFSLSAGSPCSGAGNVAYVTGVDIDGEPWMNPPPIGCDELHVGAVTGDLTARIVASHTNVAANYPLDFTGFIEGRALASTWDFGDGSVVSNRPSVTHAWTVTGDYVVQLRAYNESNPAGVSATVTVRVTPGKHYVSAASTNPIPPYTNWATAAVTIQDAVDAAGDPGDEILVTNGVYQTGGRAIQGHTNRVAVSKPIVVRSVNGPQFTEIWGYQIPNAVYGDSAIRCVYLTNGASLVGFKLTKGATVPGAHGGGVWCGPSAVVSNCVIVGNSASGYGGGAYSGSLYNCALIGNSASTGGGASSDFYTDRVNLYGCTVIGNSAVTRGGVAQGLMNNCIVYFNNALFWPNSSTANDIINYSCTTPLPPVGVGNITLDPQLVDAFHLSADSPCRGAGNAVYASGVDIDAEPWASPPSMGCDEYSMGASIGPLRVSVAANYTNVATGFTVGLIAEIEGITTRSVWEFGDGLVASNGPYSGRLVSSHAWAIPGNYSVVLRAYNESYPDGVSATQVVSVITPPIHYVAPNSAAPTPPYTSWVTAARTIQDAIDAYDAAPVPGAWVVVTNGVFAAGGRAVHGTLTNRVVVDKPLSVRSVNGPQFTVIQGHQPPGIIGDGAIRCVYLTNGASLSGFTLRQGATQTVPILISNPVAMGGGIWCEAGAVVSNCVVVSNVSFLGGGGAYGGTFYDCTLSGNRVAQFFYAGGGGVFQGTLYRCTLSGNSSVSDGGGAGYSTLNDCMLSGNSAGAGGGGAASSTLSNCTLSANSADVGGGAVASTLNNCILISNSASSGGGAYACQGSHLQSLNNCALISNSATLDGGGANASTLNNCTLTGNSAVRWGGGTYFGELNNCVVYYNSAANGPNYYGDTLNYCCTTPLPGGSGNFTNAPLFANQAGGNLRLQSGSPCINAGKNSYAQGVTDLAGNPRIVSGTVDVGAYEFQTPASAISYAWLQQYGLPINASTDYADPDADEMNNWQEWRADTVPNNASSALRMLSSTGNVSSVSVNWQSVSTRSYWVERATNLTAQPAFSTIATNLAGQAGTTTYTDANAVVPGPFFHRVGVQP